MLRNEECIFCGNPANINYLGTLLIACSTCGTYKITREALDDFDYSPFKDKKSAISSFIAEQKLASIIPSIFYHDEAALKTQNGYSFKQIIDNFPKNFMDKIDRIVLNLSRVSHYEGHYIYLTPENNFNILYIDQNQKYSFAFIIDVLKENNYIEAHLQKSNHYRLSARGWQRVEQLSKAAESNLNQVFVAMWFNEEVNGVYNDTIAKVISDLGYRPIRIDRVEHNDKIDDQIIAEIRKSKFVICDFTGNRGGVYFEAGFAMGLGKPVIWTCRQDHIGDLHFDTRQYNHIVWENQEELYERLKNRIEATIL